MTGQNLHDSANVYRARWILPVDAEPIENGTLEIVDGRIAAIHNRHGPRAVDLGNAAVVPAFVNAHTHLEFSDFATPVGPADPFTDWIRAVVRERRGRTMPTAEIVTRGRQECAAGGTALISEILTDEAALGALDTDGPDVVAYREILGLLPEQSATQFEAARQFLEAGDSSAASHVERGISPHAPYSVHPELFRKLVALAVEKNAPLAMHLAETRTELELLQNGTGPFVEMLRQFGVWTDSAIPKGSRPLDYLRELQNADRALVVHGNYLSDDELQFIAQHRQLTVVYCPRTHAYFSHAAHPWLKLLERGASVAVGTDSRASNPNLSVYRELCYLRDRFPHVEPRRLLALGTVAGARALGRAPIDWSLATGGAANLAVVSLEGVDRAEPYAAILDCRALVARTMLNGRWIA